MHRRKCYSRHLAALSLGPRWRGPCEPRPQGLFSFDSIDGGRLRHGGLARGAGAGGHTASLCAIPGSMTSCRRCTRRTALAGWWLLAVPSDDFRQELASDAAVAEFCALNFDLTLPMTGDHPGCGARGRIRSTVWLAETHGFSCRHGISTRCCSTATAVSWTRSDRTPAPRARASGPRSRRSWGA